MHSHTIVRASFLAGGFLAVVMLALWASGLFGASADTGGPSAGYSWFDNNDPAPKVEYAPMSIANPVPATSGDDNANTVDIGFMFNFFGQDYTQVDVSSNGFLSFDIGNSCNENYNDADGDLGNTIPVTGNCSDTGWGGEPLIAAWFDDLDLGECGAALSGTQGEAPNRVFIVKYFDVCHNDCEDCEVGEGVTFEVILFEGSNDIKIQYEDTFFGDGDADLSEENHGGTATVGISNGAEGLQYSANEEVLTDGLAILFTTGGLPTPTPSPTPSPAPAAFGDADCDGSVGPLDALKLLRFDASLSVSQQPGCPELGSDVTIQSVP